MIDYIRCDLLGLNVEDILRNPFLVFNTNVSLSTGEINPDNQQRKKTRKDYPHAWFGAMTLTIINNKFIILEGSLHEHYHGNNYGEFTFQQLQETIFGLCEFLKIKPENSKIHNLEFGVNIIPPISTKVLIRSILCYKGQEPETRHYNGRGYLKKFILPSKHYELKIYDKGKQHKLPFDLLRYEIKVKTMQFLHSRGAMINSLTDLLNPVYHSIMEKCLNDTVSGLIISDPELSSSSLPPRKRRGYIERLNQVFWVNLWIRDQQQYRENKIKYQKFIVDYGKNNLQMQLQKLVISKWKTLTEIPTEFIGLNSSISNDSYPYKSISFPYSSTTEKRTCKTCGRDISQQDSRSLFCSERLFGKDAKRCRNRDSNPRNNFLRSENIKKSRGLLFDIFPFLADENLRQLGCKLQ